MLLIFLGYFSNWVGWNGYKKWTYRVGTTSIEESKRRRVYVNSLKYKVINYEGKKLNDFVPYIEKGFHYGRNSREKPLL